MAKYQVMKKHTLKYEVGQIVELTDKKAAFLINKVKLVEEKEPAKKEPAKK